MAETAQAGVACGALGHAAFRHYFVTTMLSMMGDNVEHVITYWVIFQTFHSPTLAGFAVVSHWAPFLLFAVWIGGLSDRFDCRKIVQISQVAFIAVSLGWGTLFITRRLVNWDAMVLLGVHRVPPARGGPPGRRVRLDRRGRC